MMNRFQISTLIVAVLLTPTILLLHTTSAQAKDKEKAPAPASGKIKTLLLTGGPIHDGKAIGDVVQETMTSQFGADSYQVVRVEAVGPKVGGELRQRAITAVLISFLLTLLYLGFRFEWRFGLAAIVATVHDVLITFGAISLLNIEISLPTVAAVLTIIGYSLNDTIVIFDRIRENLKKHRRLKYIEILDRSINETLPRTVMTSGTTLVVLLALAVLGGAVIREFTIVLIIGVLIGTYSSIFVASPALLEVEQRSGGVRSKTDRRKVGESHAEG